MDHTLFRFDEPYGPPRRKSNIFAWTVTILLLTGFTFAAWLGSFYIFGQPERPDSYSILKKLNKIDPPKRFELTAAPSGEFLNANQLYERFSAMRPAELAKTNGELVRNYIRNFQHVRGHVPYVVGRFQIMQARELTSNDVFTSGIVALTNAVDNGQLLMEHIYPAEPEDAPVMKKTLVTGLEIKLERQHDLSAVIYVDRLPDGRVLITAIPLLYGRYTSQGTGTFSLEPPLDLNLRAGWPLFKESTLRVAQSHYDNYRMQTGAASPDVPIAGVTTPAPAAPPANALIRIEQAIPTGTPVVAAVTSKAPAQKGKTKAGKGTLLAKNEKAAAAPSPEVARVPVTEKAKEPEKSATLEPPAATPAVASRKATPAPLPVATAEPVVASSPPTRSDEKVPVRPAEPVTAEDMALASTAGGGSWKTFPAGKMPAGRLISTADLRDVADRGLAGERVYLRGQFVVNFAEPNRAVLRPRSKLTESVLRFGNPSSTRIIVEFPAGYTPPARGSVVVRDEARPYEITEVRKQDDGQLNVFVREIMQ